MKKYKFLISILSMMLLVLSFNFFAHAEEGSDSSNDQETSQNDSNDEDKNDESNDEDNNDESNDEEMTYQEKMRARWQTKEVKFEQRREDLEKKKEEIEQKREDWKQKMEDKKNELLGKRCEVITEKVAKRVEQYNENVGVHVNNYSRLYTKLEEIITKLEAKGVNVDKLKEDLDTLDDMIQEYAGIYKGFIAQLEKSQDMACGESEGAFKQTLQDAHTQLKAAIEARQKIRAFYEQTIRKDIQDLRTQRMEDKEKENEDENENSDEDNKVEDQSKVEGDTNE